MAKEVPARTETGEISLLAAPLQGESCRLAEAIIVPEMSVLMLFCEGCQLLVNALIVHVEFQVSD